MFYSDRYRRLIWLTHAGSAVVVIAIAAALFALVNRPPRARQLEHAHRIEQLRRLLSSAEDDEQKLATLNTQLDSLQQRAADVHQRIPETPQEAELLERVATIANEEGFQVADYRRGRVTKADSYSRFEIGLKGRGSFPSICRCVDRLHRLTRITTIERLSIQPTDEIRSYPVDLTIALYFGVNQQGV